MYEPVNYLLFVTAVLDARRHYPRPCQVQQARDSESSWCVGDLQKWTGLLQSQVGQTVTICLVC